ncbi:MAG: helix-turn-helix transcriptional regulator [Rhodobacterales bacterium]|nr:helix-turn-helix transcriptional regulator [Rhodobacterales bacterium]
MDDSRALDSFSALSNGTRLAVFRLLVRQGPGGVAAGEIAQALDVPPSTLSDHLSRLQRAGLVRSRRDRQRIVYAAHIAGIRALLAFLTDDCCGGRPEICGVTITEGEQEP